MIFMSVLINIKMNEKWGIFYRFSSFIFYICYKIYIFVLNYVNLM